MDFLLTITFLVLISITSSLKDFCSKNDTDFICKLYHEDLKYASDQNLLLLNYANFQLASKVPRVSTNNIRSDDLEILKVLPKLNDIFQMNDLTLIFQKVLRKQEVIDFIRKSLRETEITYRFIVMDEITDFKKIEKISQNKENSGFILMNVTYNEYIIKLYQQNPR